MDKACPHIEGGKTDVQSQCTLVKSPCPCWGFEGPCCIREAYDLGFERGKEGRSKGPFKACQVIVGGQNITEKVLKRLRPFKKKPIILKAAQMNCSFVVDTLEGRMSGGCGDFVIQGVKGELYPCARDMFLQIYEVPNAVALQRSCPTKVGQRQGQVGQELFAAKGKDCSSLPEDETCIVCKCSRRET